MKYRTDCGLETKDYDEDKGKTRQIYLQKKLIKGEPPEDYEDWGMNKKCVGCNQVKTKKEEYLDVDNGNIYKCEIKYCLARKVTIEEQLEEEKEQKNKLLKTLKKIKQMNVDFTHREEINEMVDEVVTDIKE